VSDEAAAAALWKWCHGDHPQGGLGFVSMSREHEGPGVFVQLAIDFDGRTCAVVSQAEGRTLAEAAERALALASKAERGMRERSGS
jgi:hypothetical protein